MSIHITGYTEKPDNFGDIVKDTIQVLHDRAFPYQPYDYHAQYKSLLPRIRKEMQGRY
jgi:hypothetical protein